MAAGSAGRIPAPVAVPGPDGPWPRVRGALAAAGTVLLYGYQADWLDPAGDPGRLRPLLGRDWSRYASLTHPVTRRRFAASRLVLRHAVAAVIDTAPDLVDLAYQPGGRPFVRGCDQIDVSLSHTEEVIVVGITRRGRLGVDVERADRRLAGTGSEPRTCTPHEYAALRATAGRERNDALVRLWTLKEAYSKAVGQGLRFRFTEFGFDPAAPGEERGARLVRPDGTPVDGDEWAFATFRVGRYVLSAAVCDAGFGGGTDLSVRTALDEGLLDTLLLGGPGGQGAPGGRSGDPARLLGDPDGVHPVAGVQLGDDRREVVADRSRGQVQAAGDLRGVGAPRGEAEHLGLPRGERVLRGVPGGEGELGVDDPLSRGDGPYRLGEPVGRRLLEEEAGDLGGHRPAEDAGAAEAGEDQGAAVREPRLQFGGGREAVGPG